MNIVGVFNVWDGGISALYLASEDGNDVIEALIEEFDNDNNYCYTQKQFSEEEKAIVAYNTEKDRIEYLHGTRD